VVCLALLELDHIVAVGLRPDVGQAVVDVAAVTDGHPCHLVVLELNVMVVGGIIGVSVCSAFESGVMPTFDDWG